MAMARRLSPEAQKAVDEEVAELDKTIKGIELCYNPNIMGIFMKHLERDVVKDIPTKKTLLLTGLSAFTNNPMNLFLKGISSIGKTFNTTRALSYFGRDVLWLGGLSPKALIHDHGTLIDGTTGRPIFDDWEEMRLQVLAKETELVGHQLSREEKKKLKKIQAQVKREFRELMGNAQHLVDIDHKILVFLDSPHPETYKMLKPILSHDKKEILYKFTDKTSSGRLKTTTVVIKGFPAAIFCTTDPKYEEELATRGFTLTPEMGSVKYKAANEKFMEGKTFFKPLDEDFPYLTKYIADLKSFLTNSDLKVLTPFGRKVGSAYPHTLPRDMRDLPRFSTLIDMFACFHAFQRPEIMNNKNPVAILTTITDFEEAVDLFSNYVITTRTGLPMHMISVFRDVIFKLSDELQGEGFGYDRLVEKHNEEYPDMVRSGKTLYKYVNELSKLGFVDVRPDPNDRRKKLIFVIRNIDENLLLPLRNKILNSFDEKELKEWWKQLREYSPQTRFYVELNNKNVTIHELWEKFYYNEMRLGENNFKEQQKLEQTSSGKSSEENTSPTKREDFQKYPFPCPECAKLGQNVGFPIEEHLQIHLGRIHGKESVNQA